MNNDFRDLLSEFNAHGVAPIRIDILTAVAGLQFSEAWSSRLQTRFADQPVAVLSREHLIRNKRAAGRKQDLADIERLESRDDTK